MMRLSFVSLVYLRGGAFAVEGWARGGRNFMPRAVALRSNSFAIAEDMEESVLGKGGCRCAFKYCGGSPRPLQMWGYRLYVAAVYNSHWIPEIHATPSENIQVNGQMDMGFILLLPSHRMVHNLHTPILIKHTRNNLKTSTEHPSSFELV